MKSAVEIRWSNCQSVMLPMLWPLRSKSGTIFKPCGHPCKKGNKTCSCPFAATAQIDRSQKNQIFLSRCQGKRHESTFQMLTILERRFRAPWGYDSMQARRQVHQDHGAADTGWLSGVSEGMRDSYGRERGKPSEKPIYELRKIKKILDSEK